MSEIILEFESFDLEPDSNPPGGMFCRYDRLEIWDGFPDGKKDRETSPKGKDRGWGWGPGILLKAVCHLHHFLKNSSKGGGKTVKP